MNGMHYTQGGPTPVGPNHGQGHTVSGPLTNDLPATQGANEVCQTENVSMTVVEDACKPKK